jgi:hypothetical protein
VSSRLYRLALLAFPRRHRDLYAAEMIDAFSKEFARRRGFVAAAVFVFAACANAIGAGIVERRRHEVRRLGYTFSALDFTLAWRMLIRYPGLSLVSVFGMAVGIAIATGASTVVAALMDTRLPLPGGERIVSLLNIDVSTNNQEFRLLRDSEEWRGLSSIEDLGMSRSTSKNLIVEGRAPEAITVTEISSSAFRVAGVAALRGRPLLDADASPDAEPAVVIGHEEWVRRFGADPDIADRQVQLGEVTYTIVGVSPTALPSPRITASESRGGSTARQPASTP